MNAYLKEYDEKEFAEYLNDRYGDVNICGLRYGSGYALREIDPITFRCLMADMPDVWVCDDCGYEYYTQEEAEDCGKNDQI